MTAYLIEVERKVRKNYVVLANNEEQAQNLAVAISICSDEVGMEPFEDFCLPYGANSVTTHSSAIDTEDNCNDVEEAAFKFATNEVGCYEDEDEDDYDYEPEEYFSD